MLLEDHGYMEDQVGQEEQFSSPNQAKRMKIQMIPISKKPLVSSLSQVVLHVSRTR
jgi:hypothetical protein